MTSWKQEQERQLKVLIVLFKQVSGNYGTLHRLLLKLGEFVGLCAAAMLIPMPLFILKPFFRQTDQILTDGLERAGDQIAIADWADWQIGNSINPPKVLLELAASRRAWLLQWETPYRFL